MKTTRRLADATPACQCGDYIVTGQTIQIQSGQYGQDNAWWVQCPTCGSAIGYAYRYVRRQPQQNPLVPAQ
jgi:hypothetical protein